ncbi:hypothetical protein BD289DRAFT_240725 [Coniella lustricola]|uniref:Uncharacterized protein n=1 Tax=Coniella lustricola TaxID=2025994 RepID=A0A2T3ALC3_9PEZI|nr:hypothetical protein BD289DRAFT_240725 [Coniella lustricola]
MSASEMPRLLPPSPLSVCCVALRLSLALERFPPRHTCPKQENSSAPRHMHSSIWREKGNTVIPVFFFFGSLLRTHLGSLCSGMTTLSHAPLPFSGCSFGTVLVVGIYAAPSLLTKASRVA